MDRTRLYSSLQTLLYLLRRSYAYIYSLIISSEPVSEALLPVFNQLQTLRRCLMEVKKSGGVSSPRDLYPYSMKVCLVRDDADMNILSSSARLTYLVKFD